MLPDSFRDIISTSDEQSALFKTLAQSFLDNGGDVRHLNALLDDAKGRRHAFNALAKECIGGLWQVAETPLDLGEIDFDCSPEEFCRQYPGISVRPGQERGTVASGWTETRPPAPCTYKLAHRAHGWDYGDIMRFRAPGRNMMFFAGWRELVAYISKIGALMHCEMQIVAAGSHLISDAVAEEQEKCFPVAKFERGALGVRFRNLDSAKGDRVGPKHFYLVRVPL